MAAIQKLIVCIVVLCSVFNSVICQDALNEETDTNVASEGRTFGHHFLKRISFAIIPAAFVIGVVTTLLGALTVVSIKGLGVGVILLILALGQILSRNLPIATAAATLSAPIPISYPHAHSAPVWVEKPVW